MTASPPPSANARKARYIMIGGFLGAGKTTAVAALAARLSKKGLKVGLITNDQGQELVDTAMLRSKGYATEEIPGGCFCCRFNSLVDAAERLSESNRPDVFIAEPVGSCTDLVATVTYPLRRMYGNDFTIAPLSVLIDPARAMRVFGLQPGPSFSPKVIYIFKKLLEEADIIVISKSDTLEAGQVAELTTAIAREFPRAQILSASARNGVDLDGWFHHLESDEQVERQVMDVDYEVYAEGEALLGWLNATLQLSSTEYFDANSVLTTLAKNVQSRLCHSGSEIAHFKMTFSPDSGLGDIAVINLVRNDFVPELSVTLEHAVNSGQVIINLRAEEDPERLATSLRESVAELHGQVPGLQAKLEHLEKFRPGKPTPTHRVGNL